MRACFVVCLLFYLPLLFAAEVDQFTPGRPLKDSSQRLEKEINRRIHEAVRRANGFYARPQQSKKVHHRIRAQCDVKRLYTQLESQLARPLIGQLETFAEQSAEVDKRRVSFPQSVYRQYDSAEAPTLVLSERMAAVIRIHDVEIGSDKLGHFFTEGLSYFEVTSRLRDGVSEALVFGQWSESVYFGAQTTGVFSYADLTANFNGLRFWNRILAHQPDPLSGEQPEPYIRCINKRWQVSQPFRWAGYVDQGWNEAVNCNAFRTASMLTKVMDYQPRCQTELLPQRYDKTLAATLLNTDGLKLLPDLMQPEALLAKRADILDWQLPEAMVENIRQIRLQIESWR